MCTWAFIFAKNKKDRKEFREGKLVEGLKCSPEKFRLYPNIRVGEVDSEFGVSKCKLLCVDG